MQYYRNHCLGFAKERSYHNISVHENRACEVHSLRASEIIRRILRDVINAASRAQTNSVMSLLPSFFSRARLLHKMIQLIRAPSDSNKAYSFNAVRANKPYNYTSQNAGITLCVTAR